MKINKYIKISFSLILTMTFLVGCQTTDSISQKDLGVQVKKNSVSEKKYITLTNTHIADYGTSVNNENFVMDVIKCDLSDGSTSKVASLPYTSQYPLTMYNADEDKVYYTANAADGRGDELFVMDCKNKEVEQLTQYFFAINNMYSVKEGIFIAGVKRHDELVRPYIYVKKTKKVKAVPIHEDFNVACAHYEPTNQELYVVGYLAKDDRKAFEAQDDTGDLQGITHYIYKLDGGKFKQIYSKKNCYIKSMAAYEHELFVKWGATYFDKQMKLSTVYPTKKMEESFQFPKNELENLDDNALVYVDENVVFYIRKFDKTDNGENVDQLCCYSRSDKKINVLYDAQIESAINNAQIFVQR